jgi:hypothetical protein
VEEVLWLKFNLGCRRRLLHAIADALLMCLRQDMWAPDVLNALGLRSLRWSAWDMTNF